MRDKIGSGGMAEVFHALGEGPEGFERTFVIKRIHPRLSDAPEFVHMFMDEAKISARLTHPNIVQVFEFAYHDGSYYIVMEPVDGMDMAALLRRLERLNHVPAPAFVAEIGRQACRGLEFAHTLTGADGQPLGIVHRDVTPPNIMVAWNGAVKLLDFGIARAVQQLRTHMSDAGMVKGKMSYVAPELLEGSRADARSDLFSLGVVLHELLCGQRLFLGDNDLETLKLVKEKPIPKPSEKNPGVKPALDRIVLRALARDPEKRYQNAREMGDDLEGLVMRERYSARAFAKKAAELGPQAGEPPDRPPEVQRPEGERPPPTPTSIGRQSAEIVVEGPPSRRRMTPPPLPSAALMAAPPPAPRRAAPRSRWVWSGAVVASALLAALVTSAARRPAERTPAALTAAPSRNVRVSLDSIPQGARVTLMAGASGGSPERVFGETPVLLELPRGDSPVTLELTRLGFAPLTFRVIPNQDKDAVAPPLERAAPPLAVVAAPMPAKRSSRHLTVSARAVAPPPAPQSHAPHAATMVPLPAATTAARPPDPRATAAPRR